MTDLLARLVAWLSTILRSLPAVLAAVSAVLTVVAVQVVPLLPGGTAVQVAAWVSTALAAVTALREFVARLMPAPPPLVGTTIPEHANLVTWTASDGGKLSYTSPRVLASTGDVNVRQG